MTLTSQTVMEELLHVVTKLINIMVENLTISLRIYAALEYDVFTNKLLLSRENIRTF